MRNGPYILSGIALLFIAGLYFYGNTKPASKKGIGSEDESSEISGLNTDSLKTVFVGQMNSTSLKNADSLFYVTGNIKWSKEALRLSDSLTINGVFLRLYYSDKTAAISKSKSDIAMAGEMASLLTVMTNAGSALRSYALDKLIYHSETLVELDSTDKATTIRLATALMESPNRTMEGVRILLDVVEKNPNDVTANFILGRYGLISGQFDKAIKRLEKVLSLEPENAEALYFLAEAYNGAGEKEKAILTFEKCKALVNKSDFSAEIDRYIEKIKNS